MTVFCVESQDLGLLFQYAVPTLIVVVMFVLIGIVDPVKNCGGHYFTWLKELPLIHKLIYIVGTVLPLVIAVFFTINIVEVSSFLIRAKQGRLETRVFDVATELTFVEAEHRGEKVGNNIELKIDGDAVKAIAVIPDETVEQISKEEQVEIKYGCIGNELEIWSIRVPPFE